MNSESATKVTIDLDYGYKTNAVKQKNENPFPFVPTINNLGDTFFLNVLHEFTNDFRK